MSTNAQLSQQINDLLTKWNTREDEYRAWLAGTPTGGDNFDGRYPLTSPDGTSELVDCPAKLADTVGGPAGLSEAAQVAAEAALATTVTHKDRSVTAESAALAAQSASITARNLAELYRDQAAAHAANLQFAMDASETAQALAEVAQAAAEASSVTAGEFEVASGIDASNAANARVASEAARDLAAGYAASIDPAQFATPADIATAISDLVDTSPETMNTLNELAAALGDDPNFATTMTTSLGNKSDIGHAHAISDVTSLQTALDAKAAIGHSHTIADTTGLQTALDGKQASGSYAAASHTHSYLPLTGGTLTGAVSAPNLSGTNTGDQDLSGYLPITGSSVLTKSEKSETVTPNYQVMSARYRALLKRGTAVGLLATTENLVTYSEEFDDASWTKVGSTIDANTATAPDGSLTADTFTEDTTTDVHRLAHNYTAVAIGSWVTGAVRVKAGTCDTIQLLVDQMSGSDASGDWANFDIKNGVVGSYSSNLIPSIEPLGDNWYLCSVSSIVSATNLTKLYIYMTNSVTASRNPPYLGTSRTVHIWGAQLYSGAKRLPYIKTEAAAVTQVGVAVPDAAVEAYNNYLDALENAAPAWDDQTVDSTLIPTDNLLTTSDLTDAYWDKNATVTANGIYYTVDDPSATGQKVLYKSVTKGSANTHTAIFRVKKDNVPKTTRQVELRFSFVTGGTTNYHTIWLDTDTGVVAARPTREPSDGFGVFDNGTEWVVWITGTDSSTNSSTQIMVVPTGAINDVVADGSATGSVDVRGIQLFAGTIADRARTSFQSRLAAYAGKLDDLQLALFDNLEARITALEP